MSILADRARRSVAHDKSSIEKFRASRACFTELNSFRFHSLWFAHPRTTPHLTQHQLQQPTPLTKRSHQQNNMSEDTITSAIARLSERISQHRRWVESQSERKITVDCTERTILPEQILWCADNNGAAKQWLVNEALPWWFFASFLNYCASAINGHARSPRVRRCYTPAQRHLMTRLRKYPSDDDELIQEFKWYITGPAHNVSFRTGLVDVETLSMFEHRLSGMRRG